MLNNNIIIAGICVVLVLIFLAYRIISKRKKNLNIDINANTVEGAAQPMGINSQIPESQKLTFQERVELSWKFLYDITEIIINKFSKADIELINQCGHILLNNGGRYEHVVDLAVKQAKSHAQSTDQAQQSKGQKTLGV